MSLHVYESVNELPQPEANDGAEAEAKDPVEPEEDDEHDG